MPKRPTRNPLSHSADDALDHIFESYSSNSDETGSENPRSNQAESRRSPSSSHRARANENQQPTQIDRSDRFGEFGEIEPEDDWYDDELRLIFKRLAWVRNLALAAAAIVAIQLAVWWLPEQQRLDPLGLAPRLPQSLAFMAPEGLRENPISVTALKPTSDPSQQPTEPSAADDSELGTDNAVQPGSQADQPPNFIKQPASSLGASNALSDGMEAEPVESEPTESGSSEPASSNASDSADMPTPANPSPEWATSGRSSAELESDLDQLMDKMKRLDAANLDQRRELAKEIFVGLCDVGGNLKATGPTSDDLVEMIEAQRGVRAAAHSILAAVASAPEKVVYISRSAGQRLDRLTKDSPGIVIVGRVQSIMETQPGNWALSLSSPFDTKHPFTIHIREPELTDAIRSGDLILSLASRIFLSPDDDQLQNVHLRASVVYTADEDLFGDL